MTRPGGSMHNYAPGTEADSDAPWNWKPPTEIPFSELEFQERGDCMNCGEENVTIHGKTDQLTCKECYDREPEYYDEE